MSIQAKKEKRAALAAEYRTFVNKIKTENRVMTAEEKQESERRWADISAIKAEIDDYEALERCDDRLQQEEAELQRVGERRSAPNPIVNSDTTVNRATGRGTPEYRSAFQTYLATGSTHEFRNLKMGDNSKGGVLVPEEISGALIRKLDDAVHIRRLATKQSLLSAKSLGVPVIDSDPDDADDVGELGPVSVDETYAPTKRIFEPKLKAKTFKASMDLVNNSSLSIESFVTDAINRMFARTQERQFTLGDGAGRPLGVFFASPDGIPTSRDITCGDTDEFTLVGLNRVKFGLKPQYRSNPSTAWLMSTNAVMMAASMQDENGQPLWRTSLRDGEPDRLLGVPVIESFCALGTFEAGAYVAVLGDWSFYHICDTVGDISIQFIDQVHYETNQYAWCGRMKYDGMPVLAEAFARAKLATS